MNFETEIKGFSLTQTLLSGQCFRFKAIGPNHYLVFAKNNSVEVLQNGNLLIFKNSACDEAFWRNYFDLDFDYETLLLKFSGDLLLETAIKFCGGLRILRQDPFEVLISFILSSCNNISRIKRIVYDLCRNFGVKSSFGFAFPTVEQLKSCNLSSLGVLKAGFRSTYLLDAVKQIVDGSLNLASLGFLSVEKARNQLMKIKGVGPKIANCVLLFAYHRFEVFPVDVWIKRVLNQHYASGLSEQFLSCPGFAQQLLYFSKRSGII